MPNTHLAPSKLRQCNLLELEDLRTAVATYDDRPAARSRTRARPIGDRTGGRDGCRTCGWSGLYRGRTRHSTEKLTDRREAVLVNIFSYQPNQLVSPVFGRLKFRTPLPKRAITVCDTLQPD